MAEIVYPVFRSAAPEFPPVCVKTGRPADVWVEQKFSWVPAWTWILLLFGILPFIIVFLFASRSLTARLPTTSEVLQSINRVRIRSWVLVPAGAAMIVLGLWELGIKVAWLGIALIACALLYRTLATYRFWISGSLQEDALVLRRVHPNFVAAAQQLKNLA